jgi:hypothetical protein
MNIGADSSHALSVFDPAEALTKYVLYVITREGVMRGIPNGSDPRLACASLIVANQKSQS